MSSSTRVLPWRYWLLCFACLSMLGLLYVATGIAIAQTSTVPGASQAADTKAKTANELDRARQLLSTSSWESAAPLVKNYLNKHPNSGEAHALMGFILYRERQPRPSMEEFLQESKAQDLSAFDLRIFALDCAAINDFPGADMWLRRSIEKDDRDAASWEALGHVRIAEQQFEAAIEALERALQLAPLTVSAESLIGLANERLSRANAAETAYRTAIQWQVGRAEKDAIPFIGLGRVLIGDNQPDAAISWLQQAARIPPPSSEQHELLGLAYSKTGRQPEAATELETAIRLQPEEARLHLMLARVYRSLGEPEKADAELKQYSILNGNAPR